MKLTRFTILLAVIVLLATFYRLYKLDFYPQHFDNDESVLAYDAWSIWQTGADHHGAVLPNHFRAFNEYLPGLAQYITAPFVGLLGLNESTARLPFALMGIGTVFLTALIGRKWFGETAGLLAALLLATEPWHIAFSRLTLVNSSVPFFTVLSLYNFTIAVEKLYSGNRWRRSTVVWIALSALSFALLTRTYQPLKIEAPLLFGGCLVALLIYQRSNWRTVLLWGSLYVVFTSPQWIDQLIHWNLFQVQFNSNNILHEDNWPLMFLYHYYSQYDFGNMFVNGFGGGQSLHPPGIGQLFWLEIFLWIAGIIGLARKRLTQETHFSLVFLIGWWFFIWPIAASLTLTDVPTETRTINFLPLPELFAGYGAMVIFFAVKGMKKGLQQLLVNTALGTAVAIYVVYNIYFVALISVILRDTPNSSLGVGVIPYNVGYEAILQTVLSQASDCDAIWIDQAGTTQAYIYYLFFSKYPPKKFQETARFEISLPPDNWNYIPWFANVRFGKVDVLLDPSKFKYTPAPLCPSNHRFIIARQALNRPDLEEIATSKSSNGNVLWAAYRQDTIKAITP